MEWYRILALCLSCFSLGISLTGLVFSQLACKSATRRLARMDERRAELAKKEAELEACKPLIQYDVVAAASRVAPNAARASVGMPPLPKHTESEDDNTAAWELTSRISDKPYKCSRCGHRVGAELPGKCPACKRKITEVL